MQFGFACVINLSVSEVIKVKIMRITDLRPLTPFQFEQPPVQASKVPAAPADTLAGDEPQNDHVRSKRGIFNNVFRRTPPVLPRAPSVVSTLPHAPAALPSSPKLPARTAKDNFREIAATITGRPAAAVLPSQSHIAPKSLAEVTQNLMVADRLHKAGVFSNEPKLGIVARDAFVNAGINGIVSAPMSIATYAGSAWTGEAIKGQYAAQTPILPPIHQPATGPQTAAASTVGAAQADIVSRLQLAELRIEVMANNIMAIREGTDALALKMVERATESASVRLTSLEQLYDVAEKQLKLIGDENDMIFRPYSAPSGASVVAESSRLEQLDKRFDAANKFIGKLILLKGTELPAETTTLA
ncbi:hypothetical protein ACW9IB_23195 [Pseudomonas sp. SDO524_S393]